MYETLFSLANALVMPAWLMIAVAPAHAWTIKLVRSGAWSLVYSLAYAVLLIMMFLAPSGGSMSSLAAVQTAFANPHFALLGWVHYLAFDLLVGVRVAEEGVEAGCSRLFMAPFLFFTLMFGPFGFIAWRIARAARRAARSGKAESPSPA
jgi:hypothetical protein